jgi:hypothetical protein
MCNLPNYQTRDLEEILNIGKNQTKKNDAETVEMIVSDRIILSTNK